MKPCNVVLNCDVATVHEMDGSVLSVGIKWHEAERFVTICVQDPFLGCHGQHIRTKGGGVHGLIEGLAHALRLAEAFPGQR